MVGSVALLPAEMNEPGSHPLMNELLTHQEWVRRLARRLVPDPDHAAKSYVIGQHHRLNRPYERPEPIAF